MIPTCVTGIGGPADESSRWWQVGCPAMESDLLRPEFLEKG